MLKLLFAGFKANQAHPEPCTPAADALNFSWKAETDPHSASIAVLSAPSAKSPPPIIFFAYLLRVYCCVCLFSLYTCIYWVHLVHINNIM